MIRVWYPRQTTVTGASAPETTSEKLPSTSVVTPRLCCPSSYKAAPITGTPPASTTTPLSVFVCADSTWLPASSRAMDRMRSESFFILRSIMDFGYQRSVL